MRSPARQAAAPTASPPGSLRATPGGTTPIVASSPDLRQAKRTSEPVHVAPADSGGHADPDTHGANASADLSPAEDHATPRPAPRGDLDRGRKAADIHRTSAPVELHGGQANRGTQMMTASVGLGGGLQNGDILMPVAPTDLGSDLDLIDARPDAVAASSNGQTANGTRGRAAVGSDGSGHDPGGNQASTADSSDELLEILADQLDDIEKARVAADNRLRALCQVKGLAFSRAAATLRDLAAEWAAGEKRVELELKRSMRSHRFGPWVKANKGLGEKQAARLIAAIGDPYIRPRLTYEDGRVEESRPRKVSELWSYCGYRPDQGKRKGQSHAYNWEAKMRAFLCAESAVKAGVRKGDGCDDTDGYDYEHRVGISPYGELYLAARASWADREVPDAHKHAHALRVVAKKGILKDLWRFAARCSAESELSTPAATEQLRTAKRVSISKADAPSALQATNQGPNPNDGASLEPLEAS